MHRATLALCPWRNTQTNNKSLGKDKGWTFPKEIARQRAHAFLPAMVNPIHSGCAVGSTRSRQSSLRSQSKVTPVNQSASSCSDLTTDILQSIQGLTEDPEGAIHLGITSDHDQNRQTTQQVQRQQTVRRQLQTALQSTFGCSDSSGIVGFGERGQGYFLVDGGVCRDR